MDFLFDSTFTGADLLVGLAAVFAALAVRWAWRYRRLRRTSEAVVYDAAGTRLFDFEVADDLAPERAPGKRILRKASAYRNHVDARR